MPERAEGSDFNLSRCVFLVLYPYIPYPAGTRHPYTVVCVSFWWTAREGVLIFVLIDPIHSILIYYIQTSETGRRRLRDAYSEKMLNILS